jgi:adenylate cyclase
MDATHDSEARSGLEDLARALGRATRAERCSLFLVDEARRELRLCVSSREDPGASSYRMSLNRGIAGFVRATGWPLRVDDAYAHPFFNPELDHRSGFRTRSLLCAPIRDAAGRVVALVQLLNPVGRFRFDGTDEARVSSFEGSFGKLVARLEEPARAA